MQYIQEGSTLDIREDFEQAFFKDPMLVTDVTQIMMLKQRDIIDKIDIKIVEFIYEMKFCTKQQIERFAEYEGIEKDDIEARLSVLFVNTIINKFTFVDEEKYKGKLPDDAKVFYCLHTGGKQLLDAYGNDDYVDWVPGYAYTGAKGVNRMVMTGELFLNFYTSTHQFKGHLRKPRYNIKDKVFIGGDEFELLIGKKPVYFISDIFLASDKNGIVKEKLRNYESVFSTRVWMKYYKDGEEVPTLLFITDDDETAANLASLIREFYRFNGLYLLSTKERILKGVTEVGSFLYHDKDENVLKQTCLEKLL